MQQNRDASERRFTPNQVVAYNLRRARELREPTGFTQDQAAEHLEKFLGERWSTAVFSAAERSVTGKRVRVFDADTIHALARAFEVPIGFFFLPPDGTTTVGLEAASAEPAGPTEQIALAAWTSAEIQDRIEELAAQLPATERARIIRGIFLGHPGLPSEKTLLASVVKNLKAEIETLDAYLTEQS